MQNKDNNLAEIHDGFNNILEMVRQYPESQKNFYEIEGEVLDKLLKLGSKLLLQTLLSTHETIKKEPVIGMQNKGLSKRTVITIFGEITYFRTKYFDPSNHKIHYPVDERLNMGSMKISYRLQDWIGFESTAKPFDESVGLLNRILKLNLCGENSRRVAENMSPHIDQFYENKKTFGKEGDFFAAGFDDKGVPIKAGSLGREAASSGIRLGKGQRKDVKRASTVSVTYSFDKHERSSEQIIGNLFRDGDYNKGEPLEPNRVSYNKHIRAYMGNKTKAIAYGFNNIIERMEQNTKPIVVLIDGDPGLEKAIKKVVKQKGIENLVVACILDIIHVTEYVWRVANAHFGEKNKARIDWVKTQCKSILDGEVQEVIARMLELKKKNSGKETKQKAIQRTIRYFRNHIHMMDYATYLKKGYPISTGAVESACGHFVQSRMERNGMHWTVQGAQEMLDLRAANKNKDWDSFIQHYQYKHINQDIKLVV